MCKKALLIVLLLSMMLMGCTPQVVKEMKSTSDDTSFSYVGQAVSVVNNLSKGDFNTVYTQFNDSLKTQIDENTIRGIWASFVKTYGNFVDTSTDIKPQSEKDHQVTVTVPCNFERGTMLAQITFDKDSKISGIYFSVPPVNNTPITLVNDLNVLIGEGDWQLPGSLTLPEGEGPFPAVVLVHGSGPLNRNSQIGTNTPFMDIAEQLAKQGIATLRYDKRTFVYPEKMQALSNITVYEETIEDAIQAVKLLARSEKIDASQIYVAGHSLGGTLIPRIAELTPEAAGYMILAGATRPLEDLMLEQVNYLLSLDQTMSEEEVETILVTTKQQTTNVKNLTNESTLTSMQLLGIPKSYWLDLKEYKPAISATNIRKPLLVLQGERDYQVTMTDYQQWVTHLSALENVSFKTYPKLNHLFLSGEGNSTPEEYTVKGTFSSKAIDDIVEFIH